MEHENRQEHTFLLFFSVLFTLNDCRDHLMYCGRFSCSLSSYFLIITLLVIFNDYVNRP